MDSIPISSTFSVFGMTSDPSSAWDTDIQNLQNDETQNHQNTATDEQEIGYYQQLQGNLAQVEIVAAAYRQSDNDLTLANKINNLSGTQQTLTQLLTADINADTQKNPQDAAVNAQRIANGQI